MGCETTQSGAHTHRTGAQRPGALCLPPGGPCGTPTWRGHAGCPSNGPGASVQYYSPCCQAVARAFPGADRRRRVLTRGWTTSHVRVCTVHASSSTHVDAHACRAGAGWGMGYFVLGMWYLTQFAAALRNPAWLELSTSFLRVGLGREGAEMAVRVPQSEHNPFPSNNERPDEIPHHGIYRLRDSYK